MLKSLKLGLFRILFPARCPGCRKYLGGDLCYFCVDCAPKLPLTADRGDELTFSGSAGRYVHCYAAPFYYDGIFKKAFIKFKFFNRRYYSSAIAVYMAEAWRRAMNCRDDGEGLRPDIITWVPVSAKRRKERGYDQSELLAKAVGDYLGIPVAPVLCKVGDNKPQSTLDASARAANVIGMYDILPDAPEITGKNLLLIDDIFTTGATVREASFVLDSVRPKRICCLFAAKSAKSSGTKGENFHSSTQNG